MILQRDIFNENGIFGKLLTDDNEEIAKTLEHAYFLTEDGSFSPKVPKGEYICIRGIHQLPEGDAFETFEITGVRGHADILFHAGNFNDDSEGCVLLGQAIEHNMLLQSRLAFFDFMQKLRGVDTFYLTII